MSQDSITGREPQPTPSGSKTGPSLLMIGLSGLAWLIALLMMIVLAWVALQKAGVSFTASNPDAPDENQPFLDLDLDPKLAFAIRNPNMFPVDVNKADYEMILRVPGIGVKSAQMILQARCHRKLNSEHLRKIGVVMKRAKYFITCNELPRFIGNMQPELLRKKILAETDSKWRQKPDLQMSLFSNTSLVLPPSH